MTTREQKLYTKLFVTNIPGDITKDYFVQLIQPYAKNGRIIEIKFFKRVVSESCYAFIHFESYVDGEKCMEDLNRRILNGHTMRVGPASKRNPLLSSTNLYIEGVPKEWTDADLRKHFGEFGEIAAARILVDKGSNASREVGFVHFTNHENALSAMETWQDIKAYKTAERPFKIKFANKGRKKDEEDDLIGGSRSKIINPSNSFDMYNNNIPHNMNSIGPSQYPSTEMNTPRFDEPCRYFQRGNCKRGKNCFYRHGNVSVTPAHTHSHNAYQHMAPPPPPPHTQTYDPLYNAIYPTAAALTHMYAQQPTAALSHSDMTAAAYYQHYYANAYPQQQYYQQPQPQQHPAYPGYYSQYAAAAHAAHAAAAAQYPQTQILQPPQQQQVQAQPQPQPQPQIQTQAQPQTQVQVQAQVQSQAVVKEEKTNTTMSSDGADTSHSKEIVSMSAPSVDTITPQAVSVAYGASRQQSTAATNARWQPYKSQSQSGVYPAYYPPTAPQ